MEKEMVTQYLTFTIEQEMYAIHVMKVREVLEYTKITKVPRTPDFMLGAINLRGGVVPVVDMRIKLGINPMEITLDTSIIVVEILMEEEFVIVGLLVDAVKEVLDLSADQIEPAPRMGSRIRHEFIEGMGKQTHDSDFIIILNIEHIFSTDELAIVSQSNEEKFLENVKV